MISQRAIENLINLKALYVRQNNISSLDPVSNLINLEILDCADNKINDYSALSGLLNLENLCIGENGVSRTDLSVLENLTKLKKLYAPWCGINDISVLTNMPDLEYLQLFHNNISDISSLKGLEKLTYLELSSNHITDIRALDDMPELDIEILSYFSRKTNCYAVQSLTVTDNSTRNVIQTILIPELSLFGETYISTYMYDDNTWLAFEDLNFDGYTDLRLFDTNNGNYLLEWIYLVWNPKLGLFQDDSRLNDIPLASFDQENQLIYGMSRGSAADHWYYTYQYINGVPTHIKSYSQNILHNINNIDAYLKAANIDIEEIAIIGFHEVIRELNEETGEMITIRDEYVFYPDSYDLDPDAVIARFDVTSEIGKMISADN